MESGNTPRYQLTLSNREVLQSNGVVEVITFDEKEVVTVTKLGSMVIKGERLHIIQLNLEEGRLVLEGEISMIQYVEDKRGKMKAKGKGVLERLFK